MHSFKPLPADLANAQKLALTFYFRDDLNGVSHIGYLIKNGEHPAELLLELEPDDKIWLDSLFHRIMEMGITFQSEQN